MMKRKYKILRYSFDQVTGLDSILNRTDIIIENIITLSQEKILIIYKEKG